MRRITSDMGPIELTSMVDVMFLLILFFVLCGTSYTNAVRVELPELSEAEAVPDDVVMIHIDKDNIIRVAGEVVEEKALPRKFAVWAGANRQVHLVSDRHADMGVVLAVWDLCRRAGIHEVSIAADPREDHRK